MFVLSIIIFEQVLRVLKMEADSPSPHTQLIAGQNQGTLMLNHGHFEANNSELRILSHWICD